MTRYTSIGRKRTYLDAGFDDDGKRTSGDVQSEHLVNASESPQPSKNRKRTKHKQSSESKAATTEPGNQEERELAEGTGNKAVKDAYSSRDERRKEEAARSAQSEKRRQSRLKEKLANTTCFACRQKGHSAKECPNVKSENAVSDKGRAKRNVVICYRCGSSKHTLSRCKKPENSDNPLPYASCYVCSGRGHIASSCPQNQDKGVYPNGGSCKLCGEKSHLARNCPTRKQVEESSSLLVGTGQSAGADEDDFHSFKRVDAEVEVEERTEAKVKKRADIKMGAMSGIVKSFAAVPPTATKKKVVIF